MAAAWLELPPGDMRPVLGPRAMTANGIFTGCISASDANCVREMPTIQPGQSSAPLLARDVLWENYEFSYNRRMTGHYDKQTITGMRPFFQAHGLEPGDLITIYKKGDEVMLFGQIIKPASYFIHFQRAVLGEGGL